VIAKCLEKKPENRYQTVAELADALAPFAPRSQPSVSRISGILRSASMRPLPADKSISSQRTLQSAGPVTPNPVSGDQPTEVAAVKVHVITPAPAAHSEKSTRTDWEATPSGGGRSRRALIVAALIIGGAVAVGVVWRQGSSNDVPEASPESSVRKREVNAAPGMNEPQAASAAPPAPVSPAPALSVAPAGSATPVASAARVASPKPRAMGSKPPFVPAAAAAPAAAPPPAPPPAKPAVVASDPLDGRR
jgi:hypothetical protein